MQKPKTPEHKHNCVAVLVVGMHRSGTSVLTRALNYVGCDLPETLLIARESNVPGFWESPHFNHLNDKIFSSQGVNWRNWHGFELGRIDAHLKTEFLNEANLLLKSEFGASQLFVLKDPRLCRLTPFWFEALKVFGAQPKAVCIVRNPLEVAQSLYKRNGIETDLSRLIWLRYTLDMEFNTRGIPRTFTSYAALLENWRPVIDEIGEKLDISWPNNPNQAAAEIEEFVSAKYRNNNETYSSVVEDPNLSSWLRTTYAIFDRWARGQEDPADLIKLDEIQQRFNEAIPAFDSLVELGDQHARKHQKTKRKLIVTRDRLGDMESDLFRVFRELDSDRKHYQAVKAASDLDVRKLRAELDQIKSSRLWQIQQFPNRAMKATQRLFSVKRADFDKNMKREPSKQKGISKLLEETGNVGKKYQVPADTKAVPTIVQAATSGKSGQVPSVKSNFLWKPKTAKKYSKKVLGNNTKNVLALNGAAKLADVYIIGAGPSLANLTDEEISFLNTQVTIGLNRTQYKLDLSYFISAYPGEVLLARRWLSDVSTIINMRPVYVPPLVCNTVTLRRKLFTGVLPKTLTAPIPTIFTFSNVCLAATHLALILGAKRIIYVGVEQENGLHYYDLDDDIRNVMKEELEACADFPYFGLDHRSLTREKLLKTLSEPIDNLENEIFGMRTKALNIQTDRNNERIRIFSEYFDLLADQNIEVQSVVEHGILIKAGCPHQPLGTLIK